MRNRARPLEDDRPSGDPIAVSEAPAGLVDRRETRATESGAREDERERENSEAREAETRECRPAERRDHKREPPTAGRRRQTGGGRPEQDVERTPLYRYAHAAGR